MGYTNISMCFLLYISCTLGPWRAAAPGMSHLRISHPPPTVPSLQAPGAAGNHRDPLVARKDVTLIAANQSSMQLDAKFVVRTVKYMAQSFRLREVKEFCSWWHHICLAALPLNAKNRVVWAQQNELQIDPWRFQIHRFHVFSHGALQPWAGFSSFPSRLHSFFCIKLKANQNRRNRQ